MDKLFTITCNSCGSTEVSIVETIDYDWDENPIVVGSHLQCNKCNTDNEFE